MLIWSATENTVTIMCSSIPVLRPLYVRLRYGSKGDSTNPSGQINSSYKLPMYGNHSGGGPRKFALGSSAGEDDYDDLKTTATTTAAGAGAEVPHNSNAKNNRTVITYNANNASDESILRDSRVSHHGNGAGIVRTDQVRVSYEHSGQTSRLDV